MKRKLINNLEKLIDVMERTAAALNDYAAGNEAVVSKALMLDSARKTAVSWLNEIANDDGQSVKKLFALKDAEDDETMSRLRDAYLNHYPSFAKFLILTVLPYADKDKLDFILEELAANDIELINDRVFELSEEWDELGDEYEFRA